LFLGGHRVWRRKKQWRENKKGQERTEKGGGYKKQKKKKGAGTTVRLDASNKMVCPLRKNKDGNTRTKRLTRKEEKEGARS